MTNRLPLLALALALPFAGCADADDPEVVATDDVVVADDDMMMADDDAMMAEPSTVDGTLAAVTDAGGLLELAPGAAVGNIDGWIAALAGNPDFAPVVADLEMLRDQLQTTPLDGAAIGATLLSLGSATTGAAGDDEGLQTLGGALTDAGNALTGM